MLSTATEAGLPLWRDDKAAICAAIEKRQARLKFVLKTKDETHFLDEWIAHHSAIVGLHNLIIFDNMSTDDTVLRTYRTYAPDLFVVRYDGFHNLLHDVGWFPQLYEALARSCDYVMFLDSDEFVTVLDQGRHARGSTIADFILSAGSLDILPGTWLNNRRRSRTIFDCGTTLDRLEHGLRWGKPALRPKGNLKGFVNHNTQAWKENPRAIPALGRSETPLNLFVLHMSGLYPAQRLRVNVSKLAKRGFCAETDAPEAIIEKDLSEVTDDNIRMYVSEMKDILAGNRHAQTAMGPGSLELLPDRSIEFYSQRERDLLHGYLGAEGKNILARCFEPEPDGARAQASANAGRSSPLESAVSPTVREAAPRSDRMAWIDSLRDPVVAEPTDVGLRTRSEEVRKEAAVVPAMEKRVFRSRSNTLYLAGGPDAVARLYSREGFEASVDHAGWRRLIEDRARRCKEAGIQFRQLIVPEKLTILPLKEDDRAAVFGDVQDLAAPGERLVRSMSGGATVYPKDYLISQAHQFQVYPATDSHWTWMGALSAFQLLMSRCNLAVDYAPFVQMQRNVLTYRGDLWDSSLGDINPDRFERLKLPASIQRIYCNAVVGMKEKHDATNDNKLHAGSQCVFHNPEAQRRETVVLFGTSFSEYRLEPTLLTAIFAYFFSTVHFVWSTSLDFGYIERHKPSLVVAELPERLLAHCPNDDLELEGFAAARIAAWRASRKS